MDINGCFRFALLAVSTVPIVLLHAQTVESVTSQKERCLRKLEKVERSIETVSTSLERVRQQRQTLKESDPAVDAQVEKSISKVEYLNNRIERVRNQLEKIESDLQNAQSGTQCPKCIASDVNLFWRHIESLYSDMSDLVRDVNGLERAVQTAVSKAPRSAAHPAPCTLAADIERLAKRLGDARAKIAGNDPDGRADRILAKATAHLEKGKSRCADGMTDEARTELSIAAKFIEAAIGRVETGTAP